MKNFFNSESNKLLHLAVFCAAVVVNYFLGCFIYVVADAPNLVAGFLNRHAFAEPAFILLGVLAPVLSIAAFKSFKHIG